MNTTLVNTGILNGRSSQLDESDLVALGELVESCSTNIVVSTPEILIRSVDTMDQQQTESEQVVSASVSVRQHVAPKRKMKLAEPVAEDVQSTTDVAAQLPTAQPSDAERIAEQIRQLLNEDSEKSVFAQQSHTDVPVPKTVFADEIPAVQAAADQAAKDELNALLQDFQTEEQALTEPEPVEPAVMPQASQKEARKFAEIRFSTDEEELSAQQQLELAKRRAIEATRVAANMKLAQQTEIKQGDLPAEKITATSPDHDFAAIVAAAKDKAVQRVRENHEKIARNNLAVEEISSALAAKLYPDGQTAVEKSDDTETLASNAKPKTIQSTIAILPPTAKQYVRLTDNILDRAVPGLPSAVLLTGCQSDEKSGKVAVNLAASLASRDIGKVLLIDGKIDEKELTDDLIDTNSPGLTEVLNQQATLAETVLETGLDNLSFIPAGIAQLSRQKTIGTRLARLNEELKQDYRFIIINGSPVQDQFTKTWGAFCESTYLVVSIGETLNTVAMAAVTDLQTSGSRLLGCIVTNQT